MEMKVDAREVRNVIKSVIKIENIFAKYEDGLHQDVFL